MSTPVIEQNAETLTRPQVAKPGDYDLFAHYVPAKKLADAIIFGYELTALCGKTWVPTRDYKRFPVCPDCKERWESLDPGTSDDNEEN